MSLGRKIILNTVAQTAGQGLSYLLGMVMAMLTMRYLRPDGFGTYNLVLVYVGIIGGFAELGGQIILVREINQKPDAVRKILGNFILLKLLLYFAAFILGIGFTWLLGYSGTIRYLMVLGLLSMLFSFPIGAGAVFQARLKIWYSVVINLVTKFIGILVVMLMVWQKRGLEILLFGNIIIALVSSAAYWILVQRQENPDYTLDYALLSDLFRQSLPIGALLLIGGLVFRADVLLLSKMADAVSLGLYTAAYKFVEWGLLATSGILISHLPVFSQYLYNDAGKVKRLYRMSFDILGMLLIPVGVFTVANAAGLIGFVSGNSYAAAAPALAVLIWVVLMNSWNTMGINILLASRRTGVLLVIYILVMAINVIVNYLGIPRFGFMVCAASSVLSELLAMIALSTLMRRWHGIAPEWAVIARYCIVSVLSIVPVLLIPHGQLLIRAVAFAALWLGLSVITKSIDIEGLRTSMLKMRTQS